MASIQIDGFTEAMAGIEKLAKLSTSERDRAFGSGLRKVGRGVRQDAITEVKGRYGISARARSQGVKQPLFRRDGVEVWADRKPRTAFQWGFKPVAYKTRHTRRGMKQVSWQIRKGSTLTSPRAFTGKGLPFIRKGRSRTPISVIHGPSMHGILRGETMRAPITAAIERRIAGDFVPEFHRAIANWL